MNIYEFKSYKRPKRPQQWFIKRNNVIYMYDYKNRKLDEWLMDLVGPEGRLYS